MFLSRSYNIHGLSLLVEATAVEAIREVDTLLSEFSSDLGKGPNCFISIRPDFTEEREFPSSIHVLWDGNLPEGIHATYCGDETRRWIKLHGLSLACFDLASCRAEISYKPGGQWCLISGNILPILAEFLRQADHHMIHAATLLMNAHSDLAVVISGACGTGKTTTALALANSGMKIVSDDISFVTGVGISPGSPRIWGLLPRLKVCRPSLELLPRIKDLGPPGIEGAHEVYFNPGTVRATGACSSMKPSAIIFLGERNAEGHRIKPLSRVAALGLLARENLSAIDRRGSGPSGKSFKALANLAGNCKCFALSASPRLETLYECLSPFLERWETTFHAPSLAYTALRP